MPKQIEKHYIDSPKIDYVDVPDFNYEITPDDSKNHVFKKYKTGELRSTSIGVHNPDILYRQAHLLNRIASPEQQKSIRTYAEESRDINEALRKHNGKLYNIAKDPEIERDTLQHIVNLHNLFHKTPMFKNKHRILVYRGFINIPNESTRHFLRRIQHLHSKGLGFRLPEIVSTTFNPGTLHWFSDLENNPDVLEIVANHGIHNPHGEEEFMLPSRSKFKFLGYLPNHLIHKDYKDNIHKVNLIRLLQV